MTKDLTDEDVAQRRDSAVRRALRTPPMPHKDMKKGNRKKREDDKQPTDSGDGGKRT